MNLIIFDIDGTMTNSQQVEDHCFKTAFLESLGIDIWSVEWHTLKHVTDLGISKELYFNKKHREISASELEAFRSRFVELLQTAYEEDESVFTEVPGSSAFFHALRANPNYEVAVATGSWSDSAKIKLQAIGIPYEEVPFSHSDHLLSREEIVRDAIAQAKEQYSTSFENILYFGDGEWDFKTCKNLGIPFIGVDCTNNGKLKKLGAPYVIKDYTDQEFALEQMKACYKEMES